MDIVSVIANELNIKNWQVENVLELKNEKATVPFISRYRKEKSGNLDEVAVRAIFEREDYLLEFIDRQKTIIESIESQGKMTDELRKKILDCTTKNELEDLYLPYKPKRRTKAIIAKEKGLEPLSILIKEKNISTSPIFNLDEIALPFLNSELDVNTVSDALSGAADIIAEEFAETAELRSWLRKFISDNGLFTSKIKKEFEVGTTKYETYREFSLPISKISSHAMLALRRGESEGVINLGVDYDEDNVLEYFSQKMILSSYLPLVKFYKILIKDGYDRLMKHSIIGEIRLEKKKEADENSISVFGENIKQVLLSPPAGSKVTFGVDPGFRTGCKLAVVDENGKFIDYQTIYPHSGDNSASQAASIINSLIQKYNPQLIAIGNGTAGRETEEFFAKILTNFTNISKVMVNESGASIYSASPLAGEEFPNLDLTVRGAISIARRLQDPLAELVKIDPKSIGVGQYQHDVDQKLLKKKLDEAVESCVNFVGVDLNSASKELLKYVSGITPNIASKIVEYRNLHGSFNSREELKKVPSFGDKTFEQSAGFLRIRNGKNILDNTAVHPESYSLVNTIAQKVGIDLKTLTNSTDLIKQIDVREFLSLGIGEFTLRDIIAELEKPGRDPRSQFKYAQFDDKIKEIKDLKVGMSLEGVVTNITDFGCFVDIGVHQDGLVHKSQIANQFIKDITKVIKVGQIVNVTVLEVNIPLKRISLTMKSQTSKAPKPLIQEKKSSIEDLKNKFK